MNVDADFQMDLDKCNVIWRSPSERSVGSMPLGHGDLGANVWVDPHGAVHLLLSKSDAWDDLCRLVKHGELRVLPAWPKRWNVRFRLHASQQTVVEGEFLDGRLERLDVHPDSREASLRLPDGLARAQRSA